MMWFSRSNYLLLFAAFILFAIAAQLAVAGPSDSPKVSSINEQAQKFSGPYSHDNLAIYLIHGESAKGPVPLTLEEALSKKLVKVKETGTVQQLTIENLADQEVFIQAGDIVKGGKQDRVLTVTTILQPKSGAVAIGSYCVEAGRWAARGKESVNLFTSSSVSAPSREMKLAVRSLEYQGHGANTIPPDFERPDSVTGSLRELSSAEAIDAAGQRADRRRTTQQRLANIERDRNTQAERRRQTASESRPASTQSVVWNEISKVQDRLSKNLATAVQAKKSPSSLQLALENQKLADAQHEYLKVLSKKVDRRDDVIGFAFAINGKFNSADIYPSNGLFNKMWPKLLKASITEAIAKKKDSGVPKSPTAAEISERLKKQKTVKASKKRDILGVRLEETMNGKTKYFGVTRTDGRPLHLNYLSMH